MSQDQQIAVAQDLLDRLIDLNIRLPDEYDEVALVATIAVGSDGSDYRSLVCEIVTLLKRLQKQSQAKDGVNLQVRSDVEHFHSDLVMVLKKLDYGYKLPESLCAASSFFDKFRPIDFLAAELQASLLLKLDSPEDEMDIGDEMSHPQSEKVATQLFMMETTLHISSGTLTLLERVGSLVGKVKQIVSNVPQAFLGKPLVSFKQLNPEQKGLLQSIYEALDGEYATRRKMLLTRFDTTVKSFYYSAKAEGKEASIDHAIETLRGAMKTYRPISLADLLCPCDDLLIVERVSSTSRTKSKSSALRKVILIPKVPDRGGRVGLSATATMPEFKARTDGPQKPRHSQDPQASGRVQSASNRGAGGSQQGGGWKKKR